MAFGIDIDIDIVVFVFVSFVPFVERIEFLLPLPLPFLVPLAEIDLRRFR